MRAPKAKAEPASKPYSNLFTLVLTGALAIVGAYLAQWQKSDDELALSREKFQSELILKALESTSDSVRVKSLKLLVHANLIKDCITRDSLTKYLVTLEKEKISTPQFSPAAKSLPEHIVEGDRVYILSGKLNDPDLQVWKDKMTALQFNVVGAKTHIDRERVDWPEIRYFYDSDEQQAEILANRMRESKPGDARIKAKRYYDLRVNPGYFEIWLGREP